MDVNHEMEAMADLQLQCAPCISTDDCNESLSSKSNKHVGKRQSVLQWDNYFMAIAFLSAMRSKDPATQVGACIVNKENRIVGIGYNGFPKGCSDDELPWNKTAESRLDTKYMVSYIIQHLIHDFI